ncbi:hypothetical protein BDV98DRAFT_585809 [Pterulicium gracile]|uniref:Secreted protein n=1 Tax=Pterulicium gracile TaxID=1884261 RepID=A0A5C3Q6F9_9AGAR|nr:hypothetical protein BDV98DRAFT_585809 [Pterula gracilis]
MWLRTVLTLSKLRSVFCASSSYGSRMSTSVKWYFDMVESSASWNESSSSSEDVCLHSLTAGSSEGREALSWWWRSKCKSGSRGHRVGLAIFATACGNRVLPVIVADFNG